MKAALVERCRVLADRGKKDSAWLAGVYISEVTVVLDQAADELVEAEKRTEALRARVLELEAEVAGLRAFARSVNEALNSGDGSYRP